MLAQTYGVDVAVFQHNIYFWLKHNKAYEKNFYEGRYWTFNSLAAFCETHPYWSRRQIERIISACKKNSLLLTGCFNQDKRDRTSWYSLSDKAMAYFAECATETAGCISPNGEMQNTERGQSFHQMGTPLPDINPDNSLTDNPPKAPQGAAGSGKPKRGRAAKAAPDWKPERFEGFWRMYPVKKSKQAAIRAWDSLHPDDRLLAVMGHALQRQLASPEWQRKIREEDGQGIPYPASWINGRRWEDEDQPPAVSLHASNAGRLPAPSAPRSFHTEIINGEEVIVYDEST